MKKILQLITKPNELQYHELLLRLFAGATMIYHGQGKLFNLEGTAMFFSKIGIEPSYLMALMASLGEVGGGLLVMLGLFTRLGSLALGVSMIVAIVTIGWANGFDVRQGGFEYMATLLVVFTFIFVNGAGKFSMDRVIYNKVQ